MILTYMRKKVNDLRRNIASKNSHIVSKRQKVRRHLSKSVYFFPLRRILRKKEDIKVADNKNINCGDCIDDKDKDRENELKNITEHECGRRLCKCGEKDCEFAADFFDEDGTPITDFANDEDLLEKQNLEAAEDFSEYARRCGMISAYWYDGIADNGEAIYHDTATYKMIDPSDDSADAGKS